MRMGQINELAEKTGSQIIPADATSEEDLKNLVEQSMEILGGKIDFVLHSIGMSINVRKPSNFDMVAYPHDGSRNHNEVTKTAHPFAGVGR
jgi:enoyl-[acyl-carrier-protein] reductase (NADH)